MFPQLKGDLSRGPSLAFWSKLEINKAKRKSSGRFDSTVFKTAADGKIKKKSSGRFGFIVSNTGNQSKRSRNRQSALHLIAFRAGNHEIRAGIVKERIDSIVLRTPSGPKLAKLQGLEEGNNNAHGFKMSVHLKKPGWDPGRARFLQKT